MGDQANPVLLVEDDEIMRTSLQDRLVLEGFAVIGAATVDGARLLLTHGSKPGLVITDMRLPDGSGTQVLDLCRQRAPTLPVIVMTAFGSVADAVRLVKAGALDYLEKPFSLDDLVDTVRHALQPDLATSSRDLRGSVEEAERDAIRTALIQNDWAVTKTASSLGISRKSLWEKMRRYSIQR